MRGCSVLQLLSREGYFASGKCNTIHLGGLSAKCEILCMRHQEGAPPKAKAKAKIQSPLVVVAGELCMMCIQQLKLLCVGV